ncbi:MAG: hypothetical protein LBJ67_16275 [Planctomycetaceae bacterium]|jgi:hypothetical protein|nr:hypothetical protein [Planctomycetaceae bacterium]
MQDDIVSNIRNKYNSISVFLTNVKNIFRQQPNPNRLDTVVSAPYIAQRVFLVNLLSNTKTETGLSVRCVEDNKQYKKGMKVSDKELTHVKIKKHDFHGEWNDTIKNNS